MIINPRTLWGQRIGQAGWLLLPLGIVLLWYAACTALAGCGAAPTPAQQATEGYWTALDAFCLKNTTNAKDYNACLDANRETFCRADGGIAFDSGSCVNVTLSNGLRP